MDKTYLIILSVGLIIFGILLLLTFKIIHIHTWIKFDAGNETYRECTKCGKQQIWWSDGGGAMGSGWEASYGQSKNISTYKKGAEINNQKLGTINQEYICKYCGSPNPNKRRHCSKCGGPRGIF